MGLSLDWDAPRSRGTRRTATGALQGREPGLRRI